MPERLAPGKGHRLVLAGTEELHDKIDDLSSRIRELEEALQTMHAKDCDAPHPLLSPSPPRAGSGSSTLSMDGQSPVNEGPSGSTDSSPGLEDDFLDAFGTLAIGIHGETTFLGNTARSEYLMRAPEQSPQLPNVALPRLSKRILEPSCSDGDSPDQELGDEIYDFLPSVSEATRLFDIYLEHGKYMYSSIPRSELLDEIYDLVHREKKFNGDTMHCHSLALLFIVFALAALLDERRNPYSMSAQEFYHLSRATMNLSSAFCETTLLSIQTWIHTSQYLELSDWESQGSNSAWAYLGHAVRLSHSIGLHINGHRWGLDSSTVEKRNRVFWPLFVYDVWTSFCFGRPPSMSMSYIDCPFPEDQDSVLGPSGEGEMGYHAWHCQYTILLHNVMETAFNPKPPSYSTIMELDKKIRDFPVPAHFEPNCSAVRYPSLNSILDMQRWMVMVAKEWTLLNLHRAYFAQALREQPEDLSKHRYLPSVITIYRSAWRIIRALRKTWKVVSGIVSRTSLPWSQAFSAAIVMCLLVTHAPTSNMSGEAVKELNLLVTLFKNAAPNCRSAHNFLEYIVKLQEKARLALNQSFDQREASLTGAELDRLGGKTRLVSRPSPSPPLANEEDQSMSDTQTYSYITSISRTHTLYQHSTSLDHRSNNVVYDSQAPNHQLFTQDPYPDVLPEQLSFHPVGHFQIPYVPPVPPLTQDNSNPLSLDSSWAGFMEQLGF
ncbi:hypothetical protein BDN72DRAFT_961949 [Pluteus cervinus]|uniref:Uncharacterized protein n=1 Tax=Pluteus cervinus TaxID=181527 RepID=A0ACD3AKX8_9AGAR|nr:hypothetical protein BDN72DRAFT_961949 [Pluteus cervinus]